MYVSWGHSKVLDIPSDFGASNKDWVHWNFTLLRQPNDLVTVQFLDIPFHLSLWFGESISTIYDNLVFPHFRLVPGRHFSQALRFFGMGQSTQPELL
jgi:hypothetical protein